MWKKIKCRKKKPRTSSKDFLASAGKPKSAGSGSKSGRLDSVFPQLILDEDSRFHEVRNHDLIRALKKEVCHFKGLAAGPADKCPVAKLKDALDVVATRPEDLELALDSSDHKTLCDLWVQEIRREIADLRQSNRVDREHGQTDRVKAERSMVDRFFSEAMRRPISQPAPRGYVVRS